MKYYEESNIFLKNQREMDKKKKAKSTDMVFDNMYS